jgi:hypothetical protein
LYTQSYNQSNRKGNTPTGHKGCYTKEGTNQYKSFVSLHYHRVLHTLKPSKHRPRYPHVSFQSSNTDNDPHHLVVPSGEFKMISEPMVCSTQTMDLSRIKISTISERIELSLEPRHLGVSSGASKMTLSLNKKKRDST